ncbi:MAG: glycerol-3-phosphate acyltransferase [Anaerolineae bacterium]
MALIWVAFSYLLGSVPTGYLVGRALRGIDIRRCGSGHLGGANLWAHVSFRAFLIVGMLDLGKGVIAVGVGQGLGFEPWLVVLAGWAAILGQTWSVFLGGSGGRGMGTIVGALLVLATPVAAVLFLALMASKPLRYGAVLVLLGLFSTPFLAAALGAAEEVVGFAAGAFALHFAKRMLATRFPWRIPSGERMRVLRYRLLFDRDTAEHMASVNADSGSA